MADGYCYPISTHIRIAWVFVFLITTNLPTPRYGRVVNHSKASPRAGGQGGVDSKGATPMGPGAGIRLRSPGTKREINKFLRPFVDMEHEELIDFCIHKLKVPKREFVKELTSVISEAMIKAAEKKSMWPRMVMEGMSGIQKNGISFESEIEPYVFGLYQVGTSTTDWLINYRNTLTLFIDVVHQSVASRN